MNGDTLADHETRISEIEGLFPTLSADDVREIVREMLAETLVKPEEWTTKQWGVVDQIRGEMLNLKKKFLDLEGLVTSKGYKPRYKQYL